MAYRITDHGVWVPYTPEVLPEGAAAANAEAARLGLGQVVFLKRESDGKDWYEFRDDPESFAENAVLASALHFPNIGLDIISPVVRDPKKMFPVNQRLLQIEGVDPNDPAPHKLFEQKAYYPDTGTIAPPPEPDVKVVSAVQAEIQLSRMPHDGSVVPGATNLFAATEKLVAASGDIELQRWFARSQTWRIDNPNVAKIGGAFNLSPGEIQAAFNAASKIQE